MHSSLKAELQDTVRQGWHPASEAAEDGHQATRGEGRDTSEGAQSL